MAIWLLQAGNLIQLQTGPISIHGDMSIFFMNFTMDVFCVANSVEDLICRFKCEPCSLAAYTLTR
jgi:hypothetical protein